MSHIHYTIIITVIITIILITITTITTTVITYKSNSSQKDDDSCSVLEPEHMVVIDITTITLIIMKNLKTNLQEQWQRGI